MTGGAALPRWLWRGGLTLAALTLAGALVLIIALAWGWNSPRPTRAPDWQAPNLPLQLAAMPGDTTVALMGYSPVDDVVLEVVAKPLHGGAFNGYGLVYQAQDEAHYVVFGVGSDGYYAVLRVASDGETPLVEWQQFPHIHRGQQANRLRVSCAGATCRFYINDEYATSVEDQKRMTGALGLWVRSFETSEVAVTFERMNVWRQE